MMELTVSRGTAHGAFFDQAGNAFLPGIAVAGKTGTLTAESPYRGYTWWVGFAPAERPTIAVAALVVNSPRWRIKASYVAREALRYYLVERPRDLERGG
jgi:cell division protein FtsI/penicillin-binding protein 2